MIYTTPYPLLWQIILLNILKKRQIQIFMFITFAIKFAIHWQKFSWLINMPLIW